MKRIIHILTFMALLWGCIPDPVPLKVPQADNKVVVFSQIIPNRIMIISLTRCFSALAINTKNGDTIGQDFLNNITEDSALVTVSYDNKTDTLIDAGLGIYLSLNTLQTAGNNYFLKVVTNKGEVITSTTTLLQKVSFDTIQPVVLRTVQDTSVSVRVRFRDLPGRNYYMINYYVKGGGGGGLDFNNFFSNGSNLLNRTDLISDLEMENGTYARTVELGGVKATDSLAVSLSNISNDYFEYLNQRKQSGKLLQQVFNEPINYRTNIGNGYGFFNAHYPDLYFFDLKKF